MPIELHEHLSEFSYGFGVTREVEEALTGVGIRSVPFLPSLLHEANLGFDVAFDKPGAPLFLQFKLGQRMQRFRPGWSGALPLGKPFWRYRVDTAEEDGQYETLLCAEFDGAEVFYIAPRFSTWHEYLAAYESNSVLDQSALLRPSEIEAALSASGQADGLHRVVYDQISTYLCSQPTPMKGLEARDITEIVSNRLQAKGPTLGVQMRRIFEGFDRRGLTRPRKEREIHGRLGPTYDTGGFFWFHAEYIRRAERLAELRERAKTDDDAIAAAVCAEAWANGIHVILTTLEG